MENPIKHRRLLVVAVAFGLACITACHQENTDSTMLGTDIFLASAASNNALGIAAGKLAQIQGGRDEVRAYGRKAVTARVAMQEQLMALAEDKKWPLPETMRKTDLAYLENLQNKKGDDFDLAFTAVMVSLQQDAIGLFMRARDPQHGVPDNELREYALQKLHDAELDLEEALDLDDKLRYY